MALERRELVPRANSQPQPHKTMTDNPFSASQPAGAPSVSDAVSELRHAAGDFASAASAEASKFKERAAGTAQSLKATATEKADHFKAVATDKADHYKAVATEKAQHARETAQHQWEETRVKAKEIHVTAEDYIRQNPTKAVLGALGIGFLIGLIARN
jgi:ElaB/YqjD/DUF883 family membrane-anchored ribosome-binding protein